MKICCQLPISMPRNTYGPYYDLLMRDYELFKDDATEIHIRDVPSGLTDPELIAYYGFRTLNDAENARAMIGAGRQGFDGIAGACYFDSGIKTASNLLPIPVVGAAESAMHLAGMIGHKFAVITSEPAWVMEMETHLAHLGFTGQAISHRPVRSLRLAMADLFAGMMKGEPRPLIEDFSTVAKGCIEDGADTLIVGCGLVSPVLTVHAVREISGAPIIDPMIASLKTAEMMVKLAKAGMPVKSGRGLYQSPTEALREKWLLGLTIAR
jgi:allantoin racemase